MGYIATWARIMAAKACLMGFLFWISNTSSPEIGLKTGPCGTGNLPESQSRFLRPEMPAIYSARNWRFEIVAPTSCLP